MVSLFNVHTVATEKLEKLLNDHAERGYSVRWMRGQNALTIVVFEREFSTIADRDVYLLDRRARKAAQQPEAPAGKLIPRVVKAPATVVVKA